MDWIQAVWWMISWLRYSLNHCCMSFSSPVVTWSSIRNSRGGGWNTEVNVFKCDSSSLLMFWVTVPTQPHHPGVLKQNNQRKHICCPGHNLPSTLKECSASGVVLLWGVTANTGKKRKIKPIGPHSNQPTRANTRQTMPLPTCVRERKCFLKASSVLVACTWISVL